MNTLKCFILSAVFAGSLTDSYAQFVWTPKDPWATSKGLGSLNSVAWTGSLFVAVGAGGGILTSSDGITWTNRISEATNDLNSVIWTGSQLVAVGMGRSIVTSPDGIHWTRNLQNFSETNNLYSVAWNGKHLVALGSRNNVFTAIYTSPDGITWTKDVSVAQQDLFSVTWTDSLFVAVGYDGTIITSADGFTWTHRTSGTRSSLASVRWSGNRLLVFGRDSILTSLDGITWTPWTLGSAASLIWKGSQILAVKGLPFQETPDGLTWNTSGLPADSPYALIDAAWDGNQLVSVKPGPIKTSSDGVTWIDRAPTGNAASMAWTGSQFVLLQGNFLISSPDGDGWTKRTNEAMKDIHTLIWAKDRLFALGKGRTILTSPDALTWTTRKAMEGTAGLRSLIWANNQWMGVGDSGTILSSVNGIDWISRISGTTADLASVTWTDSQWVAVGRAVILTSSNGSTWSSSSWEKHSFASIVWADTQSVAVGTKDTMIHTGAGPERASIGVLYTSRDGFAWIRRTIPIDNPFFSALASVSWTGNQWVVVGRMTLASRDGITWANRPGTRMSSLIWTGSLLAGLGTDGILYTSPEDLNPTTSRFPKSIPRISIRITPSHLFVSIPDIPDGMIRATVYSVTGRKLLQVPASEPTREMEVPIGGMTRGLYLLKLSRDRETLGVRAFTLSR